MIETKIRKVGHFSLVDIEKKSLMDMEKSLAGKGSSENLVGNKKTLPVDTSKGARTPKEIPNDQD